MASYKKEREARQKDKEKALVQRTSNVSTEPMAVEDKKVVLLLFLAIIVTIIVASKFGFAVGMFAGIIVIIVSLCLQMKKENPNTVLKDLLVNDIQNLVNDIEGMQDVINNSYDVKAVECCLEALIYTMDEVLKHSEKDLKAVGIAKKEVEEEKQYILDNYNILIKQAEDRKQDS